MNRDFKGIWIPKEIWLSTELSMLEKIILVEIDSLDNENHCTAGNEYFAEFCDCSKSAVSKAIKHLKDLGLIEELEFDGRHRKLTVLSRVVNFTKQDDKIYEAGSQNLQSNNINNNTDNKTNSINTISREFLGSANKTDKPKKQNRYSKCMDMISNFTDNSKVRELLITYLNFRLELRDKPLYANQWKGLLNKLSELCGADVTSLCEVIQQSIDRGYLSFFPVSSYSRRDSKQPSFDHTSYKTVDDDYDEAELRWQEEMSNNGQTTEF